MLMYFLFKFCWLKVVVAEDALIQSFSVLPSSSLWSHPASPSGARRLLTKLQLTCEFTDSYVLTHWSGVTLDQWIWLIGTYSKSRISHRELCSTLCNNLNGKIIWKRIDTCICITASFCCTPETNTTLLINYTLI